MNKKNKKKLLYKIIRILKKTWIQYPWRAILYLFKKKKYNNEMNILLKKQKAIYLITPKVASSSIKKVVSRIIDIKIKKEIVNSEYKEENIHNLNFPFIKKSNIHRYKDYYKFAFVRNPYDRLVSCYKNKIKKEPINKFPFIDWVHEWFLYSWNFYNWMSFKNFVKEIIKIKEEDCDSHFKSQHIFLTDKKWNLITSFIWKFENLESDFQKICSKLNIKWFKLPHLMKSNHKSYKDYYDEETKKLVTERYKKDLELFNYNF